MAFEECRTWCVWVGTVFFSAVNIEKVPMKFNRKVPVYTWDVLVNILQISAREPKRAREHSKKCPRILKVPVNSYTRKYP